MFHVKHKLPGLNEKEPAIATELFTERIHLARKFTADLVREGSLRGLIGPRELPRIWTRHILNSVLLAPLLCPGRLGDVGSGAGLPGVVLAIARPDVHCILIEPMKRRTDWLGEEVSRLGLTNVEIVQARAENVRLDQPLDQITARAVSSLKKLIPLVVPLLRHKGELLLMKGESAETEVSDAQKEIREAGLQQPRVEILGEGTGIERTKIFRAKLARQDGSD